MENNFITLSFDDRKKSIKAEGKRTIATLRSYIRQEHFDRYLNQFGFTTPPEPVLNILKKYGYKYDYKLGGWATSTKGIIILQDGDVNDEVKARNIATSKAKMNSYKKMLKVLEEMSDVFYDTFELCHISFKKMTNLYAGELGDFMKCRKTGYCDPNHK